MKYFIILLLACISLSAYSATFTVTNTNDSGAGSLRQAMTDANAVGPDIIAFNIPLADPNYDAVNGIWVITPLTELPYPTTGYTTIDGTTQTANQGNTNLSGPEIVIDGNNALQSGFILPSPGNTIKGIAIGNFTYGINIYGSMASSNTISGCYIGAGATGSGTMPNDAGITISNGALNNDILNNLISGNATAGIYINTGSGNEIYGNLIGTNYDGTDTIPNGTGILLDNTSGNQIGSNVYSKRNIISGNTDNGIIINASPTGNNIICGNFIGCDITGLNKLPNAFGIILANSGNNTIGGITNQERNIISGNTESGILINGTGAENNLMVNNYIGVDSTGLSILDNHVGILIKTNADKNIIGGTNANQRNVISGNSEIGVYIESCDSNVVYGNYIGPDATGMNPLKINDTLFQSNGIELNTVARYNIIGGVSPGQRNIISGNRVYGMIYYGQTSENYLVGNYIGTDVTGNSPLPNATGICVDASSNHNYIYDNLLSGNISYGIFIVTTGSYYNEMKRNLIGTNAAGMDTVPNDIGLLLGGGAKYNYIGGNSLADANVISGNRYHGIEIADNLTKYNEISCNYIGTDPTGTNAISNGNGIGFSANPTANIVKGNIISGNHNIGIILFESADSNEVTLNLIGVQADGTSALGNGLSGIVIGSGASNNRIGAPGEGNIIAFNGNGGVVVMDSVSINNTISANSIFMNEVLPGIDLTPFGVTANDAGDNDTGPNLLMNKPEIQDAITDPGGLILIQGTIDTQSPETTMIELFVAEPDATGYGQGKTYIGCTAANNLGQWGCYFSFPGINAGDEITATATDASGNTSEFAQNVSAIVGVENTVKNNSVLIYPNPVSEVLHIRLPGVEDVEINDITGKIIYQSHFCDEINISSLAKGLYIIHVKNGEKTYIQKIIVN